MAGEAEEAVNRVERLHATIVYMGLMSFKSYLQANLVTYNVTIYKHIETLISERFYVPIKMLKNIYHLYIKLVIYIKDAHI